MTDLPYGPSPAGGGFQGLSSRRPVRRFLRGGDTTTKRPIPADAATSERLARQPQRDTGPELAVRRALWRLGLRYRVDYPLPFDRRRRADIAFTRHRVAVFIDGCFWHGCPQHGRIPKNNGAWWTEKISTNRARDADTDSRLVELRWTVVRVWEHERTADVVALVSDALQASRG